MFAEVLFYTVSMNQNIRITLGSVVVLVLIALGIYAIAKRPTPMGNTVATSTNATSTADMTASSTITSNTATPNASTAGNTATSNGSQTASTVTGPKNYTSSLNYSNLSVSEKSTIQAQFNKDISDIKASNDLNAWADLAVLRKITGDYKGSADIWIYLTQRSPQYAGPYASLGDLYANYLHDYAKAETNYLKAISLQPAGTDAYMALFQLYSGPYPVSATAAEDILRKGMAANPKTWDLTVTLARYLESKGRTAEAKQEFEAAATTAAAQGKTTEAAQIRAEAASI